LPVHLTPPSWANDNNHIVAEKRKEKAAEERAAARRAKKKGRAPGESMASVAMMEELASFMGLTKKGAGAEPEAVEVEEEEPSWMPSFLRKK